MAILFCESFLTEALQGTSKCVMLRTELIYVNCVPCKIVVFKKYNVFGLVKLNIICGNTIPKIP